MFGFYRLHKGFTHVHMQIRCKQKKETKTRICLKGPENTKQTKPKQLQTSPETTTRYDFYMECDEDLVRRSLLKYWDEVGRSWDEVGTKFDDCGTKVVEISTKYNPEVIKYRPFMTNTHPSAARRAAEECICSLMVHI